MPQDEESIKQLWAKLVAQSWKDEKLRQRLLEEPAAVLKENGVEVPEGATIKTFEDDGSTIILPVAQAPAEKELSEEQLESVAGGIVGPSDYGTDLKSFSSLKVSISGFGGKYDNGLKGDDGSKGIVAQSD